MRVAAVLALSAIVAIGARPAVVRAQADDLHAAAAALDALESLLGWPPPDAALKTDVRVMSRSAIGFAPLPLVRLTGGEDNHVSATVTEWGVPDPGAHTGRPLFFRYLPLACADDGSLCAGTPRAIRTPEVKALWFALFIARSCNDRPRKVISDAEDLFVRGRVGGIPMQFSCRGPNPRGVSPGDRQAAAVLRITHRLLGR